MITPEIEMPDYVDWVAVATVGPYYVALEWKRGEREPQLQQHVNKVRQARERFEIIQQQDRTKDMDGVSLLMSDGVEERWISMQHSAAPMRCPTGAWNDYTH